MNRVPVFVPPPLRGSRRQAALIVLLLAVATAALYLPVLEHDFIQLDDHLYVTENGMVRSGLTAEGFRWAFTSYFNFNWHPLTWLSHMLDVELFGLDAGMHHLTSVILHILNTVLLFLILRQMTGASRRSGMVAALFALHPLHVESVAWVSERKDVLSTLFWLLTMGAYLRYARRPGPVPYLATAAAFALGLMAKPMVVTLPFVLLLLDRWPLGRWKKSSLVPPLSLLREKVPLLALTAISVAVTYAAQQKGGAVTDYLSLQLRTGNAMVSYVKYLWKMVWPAGLAVYYPYPFGGLPAALTVAAALLVLGTTFIALRQWARRPYLAVGWLWYVGTLLPVIGFVQVGGQAMADRYTYIPLIGLFTAAVWGLADIAARRRWSRKALGTAALAALCCLTLAAGVQVRLWRTGRTLFTHALEVTENNAIVHYNLSVALDEEGRADEAIFHLREALRIFPRSADSHRRLGIILAREGKTSEGLRHLSSSLTLGGDHPETHYNLGLGYRDLGIADRALFHFREVLRLVPGHADSHVQLGALLTTAGRYQEAKAHLEEARRLAPGNAHGQYNLAYLFLLQGDLEKAILHFTEALRLNPGQVKAHNNLGLALEQSGRPGEALVHYREALRLDGGYALAHFNIAGLYYRQGNLEGAVNHYRLGLEIMPENARARGSLEQALGELKE